MYVSENVLKYYLQFHINDLCGLIFIQNRISLNFERHKTRIINNYNETIREQNVNLGL